MEPSTPPAEHLPLNVTPNSSSPWVAAVGFALPVLFHIAKVLFPDAHHNYTPMLVFYDLLFGALGCAAAFWLARSRGMGATVSIEGLSPSLNGEALWTVPWSRIGELRKLPIRFPTCLDPRRIGVEVLDKNGVFQFRIPFAATAPTPRAYVTAGPLNTSLFWREVRLRLPEDVKFEDAGVPGPTVPTADKVFRLFAWSAVGLLGGIWAMASSLQGTAAGAFATRFQLFMRSPNVFMCSLLAIFIGLGYLVAAMSASSRRRHPERYAPAVIPDPVEGPRIDDYLARHRGRPLPIVSFEEGVRYRTIDPEVIRRARDAQVPGLRAMVWLYLVVLGVCLFTALASYLSTGIRDGSLLAATLAMPLIIIPFHVGLYVSLRKRLTIDDTIVRHGDDLFIVGPDGKQFSFPVSQLNDETRARSCLAVSGYTDLLQCGRDKYRLNRTRLFASATPLEHEELRAVDNLEASQELKA